MPIFFIELIERFLIELEKTIYKYKNHYNRNYLVIDQNSKKKELYHMEKIMSAHQLIKQ